MKPLRVVAHMRGAIREPGLAGAAPAMLDGLLMWALSQELRLPSAQNQSPEERAANERRLAEAMPLAREGGIWLASEAQWAKEAHEVRHINRRFPAAEAAALGSPKLKRVEMSTGLSKSYHIPVRQSHAVGDVVVWWALGDEERVQGLLAWVTHLGKKRAVGCGPIERWEVTVCESWPGFPVLLEGRPLRPLPLNWPGLQEGAYREDLRVLAPPYWERHREEACAVTL